MLLLETIILTCQQNVGRERTINSVYHILQGKTSIQTMQDVRLFNLENYYAIYPQLQKEDYTKLVDYLIEEQYLSHFSETDTYEITHAGKAFIDKQEKLYFNGLIYKQVDDSFFKRLLLLIQVWTNSKREQFKYIPIVENHAIEQWVKHYYQQTKDSLKEHLTTLYTELSTIFENLPTTYISILLDQFSGYHHTGLTIQQLSDKYKYSIHDIQLIHRHLIHAMLQIIQQNQDSYDILTILQADLSVQIPLTQSTQATLLLLEQGRSIEEISKRRQLKINTIYDHIVEIAMQTNDFPYETYIPVEVQVEIKQAMSSLHTYRLKEIKAAIDPAISYFQIRLMLVKLK